MRFNIVLASAFAALVSAQSSSSSSSSASKAATTTAPLSPVQSCVNTCKAGDVNCQAACVGVPYAGTVQVNQTTDCVANCDQGDGSAAGNNAFSQCRDKCISSFILTSTLGTSAESTATAGGGFANVASGVTSAGGSASSAATAGAASASSAATRAGSSGSASDSAATGGSSSTSSSDSGSSQSTSGSAASASSTGGAYNHVQAGSTVGGVAGLIMAVLAM